MTIPLPCECGSTVRVATAQAGSTVTCSCGRAINVPSYRELKNCSAPKYESNDLDELPRSGMDRQDKFILGIILICVTYGGVFITSAMLLQARIDSSMMTVVAFVDLVIGILYIAGFRFLLRSKGLPFWLIFPLAILGPIGLGLVIVMRGRPED
jgi:hypothetical protein